MHGQQNIKFEMLSKTQDKRNVRYTSRATDEIIATQKLVGKDPQRPNYRAT